MWVNITAENGKKYSGNSTYERCDVMKEWKVGDEHEVSVTEKGDKNYIAVPKPSGQAKGGFPQKDYSYEKRKSSLDAAISSIKLTDKQVTSEQIIGLAEKYFDYLCKK